MHDLVIVERKKEEQKTAGGIVLPDVVENKPQEGTVIAVGQGRVLMDGKVVPLAVKPGDKIIFNRDAGKMAKVDDEEYFMLFENEILAIVE
jgi:chaperonin GroES